MTIFKSILEEHYLTAAEAKALLGDVESEQAADPDREMAYELTRAIEHVNQFATLDPEESAELAAELEELETVDESVAFKIADLLPQSRDELRAIYAQERYSLSGDELDEILDIVAKYA